jgi:hypothetical protein
MHTIMIVVCRTGFSTWHDAAEIVQFWWTFTALSKSCNVDCNFLTNSCVWSRGVAFSISCGEIYLNQCCTPRLNLQHTSVLQVHCGGILTGNSSSYKTLTFSIQTDNIACWVTCWLLSLWSVHCSLRSLSLPSLCCGNELPQSPYSLTSKRCSGQSLLPFQHSAVPKILQWLSAAIKPQPSLHHRCCFLSPILSQNFRSHSSIFTGTSADLSTYIYNATQCTAISSPVQCCWSAEAPALNVQLSKC